MDYITGRGAWAHDRLSVCSGGATVFALLMRRKHRKSAAVWRAVLGAHGGDEGIDNESRQEDGDTRRENDNDAKQKKGDSTQQRGNDSQQRKGDDLRSIGNESRLRLAVMDEDDDDEPTSARSQQERRVRCAPQQRGALAFGGELGGDVSASDGEEDFERTMVSQPRVVRQDRRSSVGNIWIIKLGPDGYCEGFSSYCQGSSDEFMKVCIVDEFMELYMACESMGSRMIISGPFSLHDQWDTIGTGE